MTKLIKVSALLLATISQAQSVFSFDTELIYQDQNKKEISYLINSKEDYILEKTANSAVLIYQQSKFHYPSIDSESPIKVNRFKGQYNEISEAKKIKIEHNSKRKKGYEVNMNTPLFKQLVFVKDKSELVDVFEKTLKSEFGSSKIKGIPYRIITVNQDTLSLVERKNIRSSASYKLVVKPRKATIREVNKDTKFPAFTFEETTHDFGTIQQGESVEHIFKFTNTGDAPLLITSAKASCGCTIPNYPKTPIVPGITSEIRVRFNSRGKRGKVSKRITISSNAKEQKTYLTIKTNIEVPKKTSSNSNVIHIPRTSSNGMNQWLVQYNLTVEKLKFAIKGKRKSQETNYSNQLQIMSQQAVDLFQNISKEEAKSITSFIQTKNEEIIQLKNSSK